MLAAERKKIVIDVDAGQDDAIAILLAAEAARHCEVDIVAITCVHGNTSPDNVARNVLRTLSTVNRLDIPVFKGACSPLVGEPYDPSSPYCGLDGFGDYPWKEENFNVEAIPKEHAVNSLIRLANENPGEISLILLGPLTNMALAMKMDPTFSSKLKEISIMGGNTKGHGNIDIAREFNFYCDPDAAYVVLENVECPVYISSLELCLEDFSFPRVWRTEVLGSIPSPEAELMNRAEGNLLNDSKETDDPWIPCDPVALAAVVDRSCIVDIHTCYVTVERHGQLTRGTMLLDHLGHLQRQPNAHVIRKMDVEKVKTRLMWAFGQPRH